MAEFKDTPSGGMEVMQNGVWTTVPFEAAAEIRRLLAVERAAVAYAETADVLTNGPQDRVPWAIKVQPERIRALHALVRDNLPS